MSARRLRSLSRRAATRPKTPPNWCELDLEELPAVVDPEQALAPGQPGCPRSISHQPDRRVSRSAEGNVDAALARAPHRLRRRFYHHRYAAVPMECRGVVSAYDPRTDSVTIWSSTQVVHWVRREAAALLGMPEARVRCIALDVGGGFGGKGHVYPEDLLIPFLARRLGAAGALDRGPARASDERDAFARPVARCRDRV